MITGTYGNKKFKLKNAELKEAIKIIKINMTDNPNDPLYNTHVILTAIHNGSLKTPWQHNPGAPGKRTARQRKNAF